MSEAPEKIWAWRTVTMKSKRYGNTRVSKIRAALKETDHD